MISLSKLVCPAEELAVSHDKLHYSRYASFQEVEKSVGVRIRWNAAKGPAIVDERLELILDILSRIERLEKVDQAQIVHGGFAVAMSRQRGQRARVHDGR
jgi:hypothetical protein